MITEIKITNFKSIRSVTLDLRPINVLIGPNGAGKSNFIGFFAFVYAIYNQQLADYTARRGGADRILHLGRKNSEELTGELNFDDVNICGFELAVTDQDKFFFKSEFEKYNMAQNSHPYSKDWNHIGYENGGNLESKIPEEKKTVTYYVKKYLESFRVYHFHDTSPESPLRKAAKVHDNISLRPDGRNLAAVLYRLQILNLLIFNLIQATIRRVAPYFDRFDLKPDGDFVRLAWQQKGTNMYMGTSDLSDGTLRFIALITLLLQPEPPRTIIIDEPELGLHPYAVNVLAGLIKSVSQTSQVIISTQSVNLVDNFDPEDIIVVANENNESSFNRVNSNELSEWLVDYSVGELWNKNVLGGNP
jgi:predicted ATPase